MRDGASCPQLRLWTAHPTRATAMDPLRDEGLFERVAISLQLLSYDGNGVPVGTFATHFTNRGYRTFERFVYSVFSDTQLEDFKNNYIHKKGLQKEQQNIAEYEKLKAAYMKKKGLKTDKSLTKDNMEDLK